MMMELKIVERKFVIDAEFRKLIPPLAPDELAGLERDLRRDGGCREPLVAGRLPDEPDLLLLDGHNRHEICEKHNLRYSTVVLDFKSRAEAMLWICENQMHRRNLNETQRAMIGNRIATLRQGARTDLSPNGGMSQAQAAQVMNVGERTIQRAGVVRQSGSPKLIEASMAGIIPASLGEMIAKLPHEEQDRIAEECLKRGDAQPARAAAGMSKSASKRKGAAHAPSVEADQGFTVVLADLWRSKPKQVVDGRDVITYRELIPPENIKSVGRALNKDLPPRSMIFMRAPGSLMDRALGILKDWGFDYCGQLVCSYPGAGVDDYVRYEHELLLIGAKGDEVLPDLADRPLSVLRDVDDHQVIEKMYPHARKLVLFARIEMSGWTSWEIKTGGARELSSTVTGRSPMGETEGADVLLD